MIRDVAFGFVYTKKDSPIHGLDARIKLVLSAYLIALSLMAGDPFGLLLSAAWIASVALLGKVGRRMGRNLIYATLFSVVIFAVDLLSGYGLVDAAIYAARFEVIVASASAFFLITSPDEFEYVMRWLHLPRDLVFSFVTAVRFVPVLMLDAIQITDSQKSRGLELEKGNPVKRLRSFIPILIPLVIDAVMRSNSLAEAMEVRAYGATDRPTSLYEPKLSRSDWIALALSTVAFSVSIIFIL